MTEKLPTRIDVVPDYLERPRFIGVCDKCNYVGPALFNLVLAERMLERHEKTRQHKTNSVQHRFTV